MRHFLLLMTALLVVTILTACGDKATSESDEVPTLIPLTSDITTEPTPEPGGVDVALTLIIIPDQTALAVVNGEEILTAAYETELTQALHSVTSSYAVDWNDPQVQAILPDIQQQALDQMIERVLVSQLAAQEGIEVSEQEVEAKIAELETMVLESGQFADWDDFLTRNGFTEESLYRLMADNMLREALGERHAVAEQVRASHILVETEDTGQEVLDKLDADEDFAVLAAEYSIDPGSKDQGGDLGWFPRGVMVAEFEEAAFSLKPGETSGLVQTDFGYHIIWVHEKEERPLDPERYAEMWQERFQVWLDEQQAQADIERLYDFAGIE